jgi:hypothetical protein
MRRLFIIALITGLLGSSACLAQVSTTGTTAMGIPSTPGAIVSSPLTGPSPFSAATVSSAPDTTLAPVALALDPTTPGTSVTCVSSQAPISGTATATAPLPLGALPTSIPAIGSATGTLSPTTPVGSSAVPSACSLTPTASSLNGAALPLETPQIPSAPPPGTIQPDITELGSTSIDPNLTVIPTPNSAACSESVTINLANPGMMAPANATGATATPGVSPPAGC